MVRVSVNCFCCVVFVVAIEGKPLGSSCQCTGSYTKPSPEELTAMGYQTTHKIVRAEEDSKCKYLH